MIRACILLLILCCSQLASGQSSFFRAYSAPATAVTQRPVWTSAANNQAIVATAVFRAGKTNPSELVLVAFDRLGNIKWQNAYQSENRDLIISDIQSGSDGGLYVAGMWGLQMSSSPRPFLAAFDQEGRFRWSKTLPEGLVDSRVKIACRVNEIGLAFTSIQNLYDVFLYRFDYNGNPRAALHIGGANSEDILADFQVLPNGNFVLLVETNAQDPGRRSAGIILFNNLSGIASSFLIRGNSDLIPHQLSVTASGDLNLGLRDAQAFYWVSCAPTGQNIQVAHAIDSLQDYQHYRAAIVAGNFIAQGPISNSPGKLELIARGSQATSWSLSNNFQLFSSLSAPLIDQKDNVYILATASSAGLDFSEQLIYIKTNSSLEMCYDQKESISKTGQAQNLNRLNFSLSAGNLPLTALNLPWSPQNIQFSPEPAICNTINNTPVFPNAFSPNGDGLNDTFGPLFAEFPEYTLSIYDRWGRLIFRGQNQHWDGKMQSEYAQSGSYPYVFDYADTRGRISRISGQLTLIR